MIKIQNQLDLLVVVSEPNIVRKHYCYNYSKLLLQSKLVRVRNNKDGSRSISVDRNEWNLFLGRFELRGDIYGKGGCVELTDGKIKHAAIERTMGGRIDHTTTTNQKSVMMCVLRVGAVAPGETPPSNTAINRAWRRLEAAAWLRWRRQRGGGSGGSRR